MRSEANGGGHLPATAPTVLGSEVYALRTWSVETWAKVAISDSSGELAETMGASYLGGWQMQVQMAVDIEAPPEKVWPYLVEPDKTMQWYTMLKKFEYTSEGTGPDSTFYWEEMNRGKMYSNHFRTTEWEANRVFAYEMTSGNFFKSYTERWEIKPTPTGCQFSFDDTMVFPYGPFGKIMGWFGERMAKKSSQEILQNLKRLAEA